MSHIGNVKFVYFYDNDLIFRITDFTDFQDKT